MATKVIREGDYVWYQQDSDSNMRHKGYVSRIINKFKYIVLPDTSTTKQHHKFVVSSNKVSFIERIDRLPTVRTNVSFAPQKSSIYAVGRLKIGDTLDHKDKEGRWCLAKILEKNGKNLLIHYYGRECDEWSNYQTSLDKFAKAGSISMRPASNRFRFLKIGSVIQVQDNNHWNRARICVFDGKSGQVRVEV